MAFAQNKRSNNRDLLQKKFHFAIGNSAFTARSDASDGSDLSDRSDLSDLSDTSDTSDLSDESDWGYWRFSSSTMFSTWWVWGNMSTGCTSLTA